MCVDDYQFRHYSAKRQKICKRFIFKTEEGHQRTFLVNISQFERFGQLCLCSILMHLSKKGLNVKDYSFYMPQLDITIEAGDKCKIPFDKIVEKQVYFQMKDIKKYQKTEEYQSLYFNHAFQQICQFTAGNQPSCCQQCKLIVQSGQKDDQHNQQEVMKIEHQSQHTEQIKQKNEDESLSSQEKNHQVVPQNYNIKIKQLNITQTQSKKHKQQEKTIEQALMKTKTWRMLHEICQFSLKNSANMVGLSKKTLDDYFLVLRVAQFHGYNFKSNLGKKIGHLRAFIRNQPIKVTGRLSKEIRSFYLVPEPDLTIYMPIKDWSKVEDIQQIKSSPHGESDSDNFKGRKTNTQMQAQ